MPDNSYISQKVSKGYHEVSISKANSIEQEYLKPNYNFLILFRKDFPIRKYQLIEITKEYFQSLQLDQYRNLSVSPTLNWGW